MRRTIALVAIAAAVAASTWLVRGTRAPDRDATNGGPVGISVGPAGTGLDPERQREIDRLIAHYEDQVRRQPSTLDLTFLGELYLERARIGGDVRSYASAEEALTRALAIGRQDREARALLATTRFATHDFLGALELAEGLVQEDRRDDAALAIAGDAQLELGRYGTASDIYEELARRLPGTPEVEARRARLAFLTGDVDKARRLAAVAEEAAHMSGLGGTGLAWYTWLRGQIEFDTGEYEAARRLWGTAVRLAPDYHLAHAGKAKALAALGMIDEAIREYVRAIELLPDPTYVAALGDLYILTGDRELARSQYRTVEAIATVGGVNGRLYDRQLAGFYADHDRRVGQALQIASRSIRTRGDVYGWDVYAWALYRAGEHERASAAIDEALRLGTPDPRLHYHAGMIALARGDEVRARAELELALRLGPAFDPLQAVTARQTLGGLE
ncbi:MAG: tetratricopeptide repeat protein [Actinomycetota bacterium]|nr:tetratricopeptide repeat protein [Actinomycetota bacterium]